MNQQKLLEQLALAKEAGRNAMAKDFFAKTPNAAEEAGGGMPPGPGAGIEDPNMEGAGGMAEDGEPSMPGQMPEGSPEEEQGESSPEELEELLRLLEQQQGQGQ